MSRYNTVQTLFTQQNQPIIDSTGKRWVQCEICGAIKQTDEFAQYGGMNHINLGICFECNRKQNH
jgi:hypothetical protein